MTIKTNPTGALCPKCHKFGVGENGNCEYCDMCIDIEDEFVDLLYDLSLFDLRKLHKHFMVNSIKNIQINDEYIRFNIKREINSV